MNQDEKIVYLNQLVTNNCNISYSGPASLFKYRPFDEHTYDMLENEYMFLCPAEREDDKTECMTTVDIGRLIEVETNNLKRECVDQIFEFIKPHMCADNYEMCRSEIYSIMNANGIVQPRFMLDMSHKMKEMVPKGFDISPLVNWIVNIPNKLDEPEISSQLNPLIEIAYQARKLIGLCSLAESNDNEDLWNEYAANNTGYCVEYDINDYELNKDILPVIYDDNRKTNIIIQLVGSFIGQMIMGMSNGQIYADATHFIRLFLTKNLKWSYQNEWRFVGKAGGKPKSPKVKCIYIGKNASIEDKNKMIEFAKQKNIKIEMIK